MLDNVNIRTCIYIHMCAHMVFPLVNIHQMLQYGRAYESWNKFSKVGLTFSVPGTFWRGWTAESQVETVITLICSQITGRHYHVCGLRSTLGAVPICFMIFCFFLISSLKKYTIYFGYIYPSPHSSCFLVHLFVLLKKNNSKNSSKTVCTAYILLIVWLSTEAHQ